ncbi:MAG: hypothetical protein Q7U16_15850 [Agitococcus sp.]|nr:hypothetical protein [Agitococcus sp.]
MQNKKLNEKRTISIKTNMWLKRLVLLTASSLLSGCFALRHSGYSVDMQPTKGWKIRDDFLGTLKFKTLGFFCDSSYVDPAILRIEYLTWIGPPFLPIFPVTRPDKFYPNFRLFYQNFKVKSIDNCPAISINRGAVIKAYSFSTEDTCYYWPEIPPTDFTMSFEGGLDGCNLDDLNFKVEPFSTVDWFWTFKG